MSLERIAEMYSMNLEKFSLSSRSIGWNSDESRELRYEYLNVLFSSTGVSEFSVNDFGCGYGGHLEHLCKSGLRVSRYYGYDISSAMASEARSTAERLNIDAEISETDKVVTQADFSLVSGTFNVKFDVPSQDWESYVHAKLIELGNMSRLGFAFNLLSTKVDWQEPNLFYANPGDFINFVQENISGRVILFHDAPLFEWTMVVLK